MSQSSSQSLIVLAQATAVAHKLSPELVCAVVEQESNWDTWAIRFEAAFEKRYIHPAIPTAPTTEELSLAISWGLMQVMGQSAREHGFNDRFFARLCHADVGLEIGCRILSSKWARANGDLNETLQLWNGGGNPNYSAQVIARIPKYRGTYSLQ